MGQGPPYLPPRLTSSDPPSSWCCCCFPPGLTTPAAPLPPPGAADYMETDELSGGYARGGDGGLTPSYGGVDADRPNSRNLNTSLKLSLLKQRNAERRAGSSSRSRDQGGSENSGDTGSTGAAGFRSRPFGGPDPLPPPAAAAAAGGGGGMWSQGPAHGTQSLFDDASSADVYSSAAAGGRRGPRQAANSQQGPAGYT